MNNEHDSQAALINKQANKIRSLERENQTLKTLYRKYFLLHRKAKHKASELTQKLNQIESERYTEEWIEANPHEASDRFWQLWRGGAESMLCPDSRKEIFLGILAGSSDITDELFEQLKREYN